jgi:hypothetical protein
LTAYIVALEMRDGRYRDFVEVSRDP